jgi:hypothetical protein
MFDKLKVAVWKSTGQGGKLADSITKNFSEDARRSAMKALDEVVTDPERKLPILKVALDDYRSDVRLWAIRGAARIGGSRAVAMLIPSLNASNDEIREAARQALDRSATDRGTQYRIATAGLMSCGDNIRTWSIGLLAKSGQTAAAMEPIIERLRDKDEGVRESARRALSAITIDSASRYRVGLRGLNTYSDTNIWAISLLAQSGRHEAISAVASGLGHGIEGVRIVAREALATLATDSDSQYAVGLAAIRDGHSDNHSWGLTMLVRSGKRPGFGPILEAAIKKYHPSYRVHTIDMLDSYYLALLSNSPDALLKLGVHTSELEEMKRRYAKQLSEEAAREPYEGGEGGGRQFWDSWDSINFGTPPGSSY